MTTTKPGRRIDETVRMYPGALSVDECEEIIEACRPYGKEHEPDSGGRLIACALSQNDGRLSWDIYERLAAIAAHTVHVNGWDVPFDVIAVGASRYRVGHWMAEHVDDEARWPDPATWTTPHRGVSMSVPLTTGHEGGKLRMRMSAGWAEVVADPGTAVVFGGSLPHEVTPVTEGERWVLLMWCYLNRTERLVF